MAKVDIKKALAQFALFNGLDNVQLELLAKYSQELSVSRGQHVFSRGDTARGLYLLLKGQLKLGVTSILSVEKVVSIIGPGESFGETGLFLDNQLPFYAKATMNSKILLVPEYMVHSLLDSNANVARKMQETLSVSLHQMIHDIETLTLPTAIQRFAEYLLRISNKSTKADNIILPVRKETIASILNITPETLSRCINKLNKIGLIEVNGNHVAITDIVKLRELGFDN
ncbi:cAMP receptor protein [mine drainage metagenome]|uniref:cAMP receptor protein n=1 Tax=mine drainage metagenome TaxID=410659 RepID=A0A1J5RSW2_9ZZZZ